MKSLYIIEWRCEELASGSPAPTIVDLKAACIFYPSLQKGMSGELGSLLKRTVSKGSSKRRKTSGSTYCQEDDT